MKRNSRSPQRFLMMMFILCATMGLAACGSGRRGSSVADEPVPTADATRPPDRGATPISGATAERATAEPTRTPSSVATQVSGPIAEITAARVTVRGGVGSKHDSVTTLASGEIVSIIGQADGCSWIQIQTASGLEGWLPALVLTTESGCTEIPAADPGPDPATSTATVEPKPTATQTPVPTATLTPVPTATRKGNAAVRRPRVANPMPQSENPGEGIPGGGTEDPDPASPDRGESE